jgi:hypothetical protein
MAVLSDALRIELWAAFMREAANVSNGAGALTKAQLRAAVNGVDDWAESNATSFNNAIPQPARGAMTTKQKTMLLQFVILKRAGVL